MGYAKERGKLEKLLVKTAGIDLYNEKNLAILIDGHEKYSHTIRILKNKEPESFEEMYKNDLEKVKAGKKAVKESETDESRQANFISYKETIVQSLEHAIATTRKFL